MGFRRLKYLIIIGLLINSCTSNQNEYVYIYNGYYVNDFDLDKGELGMIQLLENSLETGGSYYQIMKNEMVQDSFIVIEKEDTLIYKTPNCDEVTRIILMDELHNNNNCTSVYPFFLESITLLDVKKIKISGVIYEILKLSNESNEDSSCIYWLKGFGIIMIIVPHGAYYQLETVNNKELPWQLILNEMKQDLDFSQLRKIPPAPPPPDMEMVE